LTTYKKRNTIIYNLDYTQSNKIYEFFNVLNQNTYEPFDTNELLELFLLKNNLSFSKIFGMFSKNVKNPEIIKKEEFDYDNLILKDEN
jgi:hypothetical protein